ncbi:hypothetical protein [Nonomuraea fuscirosea]|uniref:hypothetical protein n=1 Tax=Nonomuraea fuscirosea TaxID=1291556 RepID=UPI003419D60B
MTDKLPLLDPQLVFGLEAQRSGRRGTVTMMFRTPPSRLSAADVSQVLQSVVNHNPALSYRIRFSRGTGYQERFPAEFGFAESYAASEDAVSTSVIEAIEEFETTLDGPAVSAFLIRSIGSDHLLLVFDHALVDEQSLRIIRRQLDAPSSPDDTRLARYQAAVHDRKAFEDAAGKGPGIPFWADRLTAIGRVPEAKGGSTRFTPVVSLPSMAIPRSFGGSLFPYVLFSVHGALRDLGEPGPTAISYPWGNRNTAYSDVVGCFMNTCISFDPARSPQTPDAADDFVSNWYEELDHADVPFTAITTLGSAFSGSITAQLSFTRAGARSVTVAGVPAVEVMVSHIRISYTSTLLVAATVCDDELRLRLILDEESVGYGAQEFGSRWCHWLDRAISSSLR